MRYIYISFLLLLAIGCKQNLKSGPGGNNVNKDTVFTINGTINAAAENEIVILQYLGIEKTDTAYIKSNNFTFKGSTPEPLMAILYLPQSLTERGVPLSLVVENAAIHIEGAKDSVHQATVVGGLENTNYNALKKILKMYELKVNNLTAQAENAQSTSDIGILQKLQNEYNQLMTERQQAIKQFVIENPASIAGAYFVYQDLAQSMDHQSLDSIYQKFDPSISNTIYVTNLKNMLDVAQTTAIGKPAPNLTLNDAKGNLVSLSSLKGKYVLVDFWASWCGPCRQENPNVVNAYKQYKNKDFTILGVSLDENKDAWLQAIQKDELTWLHVSDLKGWKSDAAARFGVQAIPANFLLNKEGVIIAKDLREASLHQKLSEVLN